MTDKKPEPNVYMNNTPSLLQALDNMREKTPEEIKIYRKNIDKGRMAVPKKGKKKKDDEIGE